LRWFQQRQGRLRQWARKLMPAGPAVVPPVLPAPAARFAAKRDHDAAALHWLQAMEARHTAERRHERDIRAGLQRQAAQSWQADVGRARAESSLARYANCGVAYWHAAQNSANDNRPVPRLPVPRPRPF
jgi:hypothetical protein